MLLFFSGSSESVTIVRAVLVTERPQSMRFEECFDLVRSCASEMSLKIQRRCAFCVALGMVVDRADASFPFRYSGLFVGTKTL